MKKLTKKDQEEMKRITQILFPNQQKKNKRSNNYKENSTSNHFHSLTNKNVDLKTDLQKMRNDLQILLDKESVTQEQLNVDSRRYYEQIKILSDKLNNYPSDILQAGMNLVNSLPIHVFQANLKKLSKINLVGSVLQKFIKRKRRIQKMEALRVIMEMVQANSEQQQDKLQSRRNLQKILKKTLKNNIAAYFNQWRYTSYQIKQYENNQVSSSLYSKSNCLKFSKLLPNEGQFIRQMSKQLTKILKNNFVQLLIYDQKSNTLRGYVQIDENLLQHSDIKSKPQDSLDVSMLSRNSIVRKVEEKMLLDPELERNSIALLHKQQQVQKLRKVEMPLEYGLTQQCLNNSQAIVCVDFEKNFSKVKLDYPIILVNQTLDSSRSIKQKKFSKVLFTPIIFENKKIGVIRQYFKLEQRIITLSQQAIQFISVMLKQCSELAMALRTINQQNTCYQKGFYKQLIKILQNIKHQISIAVEKGQSINIFKKSINLLKSCDFMKNINEIAVYAYKKSNIGINCISQLEQIIKSVNSTKEYLMPALQALQYNSLPYIKIKDHLLLSVEFDNKNYLYDFSMKDNTNEIPFDIFGPFFKQIILLQSQQSNYLQKKNIITKEMQIYHQKQKHQSLKYLFQKSVMKLFEGVKSNQIGRTINKFLTKILEIELELNKSYDYKKLYSFYIVKNGKKCQVLEEKLQINDEVQTESTYSRRIEQSYEKKTVNLFTSDSGLQIKLQYRFKSTLQDKIIEALKHFFQCSIKLRYNESNIGVFMLELQKKYLQFNQNYRQSERQNLKRFVQKSWNCSSQILELQDYHQKIEISSHVVYPTKQSRTIMLFLSDTSKVTENYQLFDFLSEGIPKELKYYLNKKIKQQQPIHQFSYIRLKEFGIFINSSISLNNDIATVLDQIYQKMVGAQENWSNHIRSESFAFYVHKLSYTLEKIIKNQKSLAFQKFSQNSKPKLTLQLISKKLQQHKIKLISESFLRLKANTKHNLYSFYKIVNLCNTLKKLFNKKCQGFAFRKLQNKQIKQKQLSLNRIYSWLQRYYKQKIKAGWKNLQFYSSYKSINKKPQLSLYRLVNILNCQLKYSFSAIRLFVKTIPEIQTDVQLISSNTKIKPLLCLVQSLYPQFTFGIKIDNQNYMSLNEGKIMILSLSNLCKMLRQKKGKQCQYYQVIQKIGHQIWFHQKQLSVQTKNKLTTISRAIQQTFNRILTNLQPWIKSLDKNYKNQLDKSKVNSWNCWKEARINSIRFEHYNKKDEIYHLQLETQTLTEKTKLKLKKQQETNEELQEAEEQQQKLEQQIKQLIEQVGKLNEQIHQVENYSAITMKKEDIQNMKICFRKWRLTNSVYCQKKVENTMKNIFKIAMRTLNSFIEEFVNKKLKQAFKRIICESIRIKIQSQDRNKFATITDSQSVQSICGFNKQQTEEQQLCIQYPVRYAQNSKNTRLLTFQNDSESDCFIDIKGTKNQQPQRDIYQQHISYPEQEIHTENDYILREYDNQNQNKMHLQPLQMNRHNCQVTEEQIKRINSGVYKLNYKTIKFLKRMGKLNES